MSSRPDDLEPSGELGPALEFMQVIWALSHALEETSRDMESSIGVTGQQRLVIRIVGTSAGVTPGDVARILRIHPSTTTGLVKRLEQRGLLTRHAHPFDGRRQTLALTARGRRINARSEGTIEQAVRGALRNLSPGAVATTATTLNQVITALQRR